MASIHELKQDPIFQHFYTICQIPHNSGNEEKLSTHILRWARQLGLEAEQDSVYNLLIRKPATPGYEAAPAVMLQAHLDMVCEKAEGVEHNFDTDPITWHIDGDIISTGGRTTLGADDGIGVALAMAILADEELQHPALEVLLTAQEEAGLHGIEFFDTDKMTAKYLLNLDHVKDSEILCGSCGGQRVDLTFPLTAEPIWSGWTSCRLAVSGLKGGHSGEDIHRGRGNANILLNRALMALESCCDFRLSSIRGGNFSSAIPREAEATIWFAPSDITLVQNKLAETEAQFRSEFAVTSQNISITLCPAAAETNKAVSPSLPIKVLSLCPDGIYQMSEQFEGIVDASDNIGIVSMDEEALHLVILIRFFHPSEGAYLLRRMQLLAELLGGVCETRSASTAWDYSPASKLREICTSAYKEVFQTAPRCLTVHAGLEVGVLCVKRPGLDAVSIGPNCWEIHSPSERLSISSAQKMYTYLRRVLAALS